MRLVLAAALLAQARPTLSLAATAEQLPPWLPRNP
eukprot:COSAG06_NODE_33187_length_493_cov_9.835025_1_plen_34_part_10